MDHGLMNGMLVAGVLLSAIPISLGIAVGVQVLRRYRASRAGADRRGAS